jgi:hypothetical protein
MTTFQRLALVLVVLLFGGVTSTMAQAEEVLVTADWVEERLEDPSVRLIEVSVVPGVFERGHIGHQR